MKTLSLLWTIFLYWRALRPVLERLVDAYNQRDLPMALQAIGDLIGKLAPPAATADSAGTKPADEEGEKRRRLIRLLNRTRIAGEMTDGEVQHMHTAHNMTPYREDMQVWT